MASGPGRSALHSVRSPRVLDLDRVPPRTRVSRTDLTIVLGAALALVLIGVARLPSSAPSTGLGLGVGAPAAAEDRLAAAGDTLESLTTVGGSGYSFTALQRNRLHAKPAGPRISITDPKDQAKVLAVVDERLVNAMVSTGTVRPEGFYMEMRLGPADGVEPDLSTKPVFTVLVDTDGTLWRDDGAGWYRTDIAPGMGFDPASAGLLPSLLRRLTAPTALGAKVVGGVSLAAYRGGGTVVDYPGVVAADGKDFTSPAFEVAVFLDDQGRLARLETVAQNRNQKIFDLLSETALTFGYDDVAAMPAPEPTMAPESPPPADPADQNVGP